MFFINLIALANLFPFVRGAPINATITSENSKQLEFILNLPNNDTVLVNLSFKLLKASEQLPVFNETLLSTSMTTTTTTTTTTTAATTTTTQEETSTENGLPQALAYNGTYTKENESAALMGSEFDPTANYVTVEEAIESFRQSLMVRGFEIGGILQSDRPFYRHFKLEYTDGVTLYVRCTYTADYENRSLKIACYEYREIDTSTIILSNGEVDKPMAQPLTVEYINASTIKQLYSMRIS